MPAKKKLGAVKKAVAAVKPKAYVLEVSINEEVQKIKAESVHEALQQVDAPSIIKTGVMFKLSKGSKSVDKEIGVHEARQTFANSIALELLAKSLSLRLG